MLAENGNTCILLFYTSSITTINEKKNGKNMNCLPVELNLVVSGCGHRIMIYISACLLLY